MAEATGATGEAYSEGAIQHKLTAVAAQVRCVECGNLSPPSMGEVTLTSTLGWRLARSAGTDGTYAVEWRCPECWARYKARRVSTSAMPSVFPGAMPDDGQRKK